MFPSGVRNTIFVTYMVSKTPLTAGAIADPMFLKTTFMLVDAPDSDLGVETRSMFIFITPTNMNDNPTPTSVASSSKSRGEAL